ncbi:hypothetical protein CUMW_064200 [Citrus unshiu]|nr:hypothetical protein CUMW_064200 [Citrus unshiu]
MSCGSGTLCKNSRRNYEDQTSPYHSLSFAEIEKQSGHPKQNDAIADVSEFFLEKYSIIICRFRRDYLTQKLFWDVYLYMNHNEPQIP